MGLQDIATGDAIADFLVSARPPNGVAISDAQLKFIWEGIATRIDNNIRDNGVVNTTGADPQGGSVTSTGTMT